MKHVEVSELVSAVSMTRSEKLRHWAKLIRETKGPVALYNGLEYLPPARLEMAQIGTTQTALAVAASDPVFQAQGLNATTTLAQALRFFGLSLREAHAFSCDCGGAISNEDQARRIERLA